MEISIFTKDNETWTRFKISNKEIGNIPLLIIELLKEKQTKISSRFYYYEIKGDFLNNKY